MYSLASNLSVRFDPFITRQRSGCLRQKNSVPCVQHSRVCCGLAKTKIHRVVKFKDVATACLHVSNQTTRRVD